MGYGTAQGAYPGHSDGWDKDAWTEPLQQDVGKRFKYGIDQEEDGESDVILAAAHIQVFLEPLNLRIADIGAVQEGD